MPSWCIPFVFAFIPFYVLLQFSIPTSLHLIPACRQPKLLLGQRTQETEQVLFTAWRPTRGVHEVRDHIRKLRICYKNCTIIYSVRYTTFYYFSKCGRQTRPQWVLWPFAIQSLDAHYLEQQKMLLPDLWCYSISSVVPQCAVCSQKGETSYKKPGNWITSLRLPSIASIRCVTTGLRVPNDYVCSYRHTIDSLFL